jgi:lipoprotein-anchoring transpeptidase ErfK/SrfK
MSHNSKIRNYFLILLAVAALMLTSIVFLLQNFPGEFRTSASISKSDEIKSGQAIEINFSFPVIQSSIEKSIKISPETEFSTDWKNSGKTLRVTPKKIWNPQADYQISISGGENILHLKFNQELSFLTQAYPKIKTLIPLSGEKNVAVDMEEPIDVGFDKSLEEYNVKFEVSPAAQLEYQMNTEKNNIKLLAKDNFAWGTNYSVGVFLKNKKQTDSEYVKVGQTSFETAAPQPTEWDKDPAILLEQAKKYTKPLINNGKYIDINLKYQVMVIFENGQALDSYRISSGKKGLETPEGRFKIENKSPRAWSKKYSLFMPNWMAILPSGEVGIHELPVWPGGYQEGANHLGIPVSHGCVRLGPEPAKRVYQWAEIGTPVVVHK